MSRTDPRGICTTPSAWLAAVALPFLGFYGLPGFNEADTREAIGGGAHTGATTEAVRTPTSVLPTLDVQGTIEATIGGERMTFYSISGASGGRPYSSSTWMEMPSGGRMVAMGGFATPEPPLDAFQWDADGMPSSYGSYDGPVFGIGIPVSGEETSFTITFPGGGAGAILSYQPTASLEDVMGTTYMMQTGTVSVTDIGVSGGVAHATGTFAGTFRLMAGEGSVEITDGSFSVEGVPGIEALRPPGGFPESGG